MDKSESIRCMLLPLAEDWLLLPNVTVAEVISYVEPETKGSDDFNLGKIDWRGVKVPILSFEKICDLEVAENTMRNRIAILYHPEGNEDKPYVGVKLKDIPKSFIADTENLVDEPISIEKADSVLNQLSNEGKRVFIPDLDKLFDQF